MKNTQMWLTLLTTVFGCLSICHACETPGIYETGIVINCSINKNDTHFLCPGEVISVDLSTADADFLDPEIIYDNAYLSGGNHQTSMTVPISYSSGGLHTWTILADDECLSNNIDDPVASLSLSFCVVGPDLRADVNWDGNFDQNDEAIEGSAPGLCLPLNDDDDNLNGIPDNQEAPDPGDLYPNNAVNDLVRVMVTYKPEDYMDIAKDGTITLASGSGIRAWVYDTSSQPAVTRRVALPKTYRVGYSEVPSEILVEGYSPGESELLMTYQLPNGGKSCTDTIKLSVVKTDLTAKGHDFNNPNGAGETIEEAEELAPGAYIHFNIDNDDESGGGTSKYPGGDFLQDDTVTGEDDLKQLACALTPSGLTAGRVVLARASGDIQVWKNAQKGSNQAIFTDPDDLLTKTWDLANPTQRADFNAVKNALWVEGTDVNTTALTLSLKMGNRTLHKDTVNYKPIAATCGDQPSVELRADFKIGWPELVDCEYSITGPATSAYNCYAWSVDATSPFMDYAYLVVWYGDHMPPLTMADIDDFYWVKKSWFRYQDDPESSEAMHYTLGHGARRKDCACGAGNWTMYESKLGDGVRIEHLWDQLGGGRYGEINGYYR